MKKSLKIAAMLSPLALVACAGGGPANDVTLATSDSVKDIVGPLVTDNRTVYSSALVCLKGHLPADTVFAIGPVPDKTGKYVVEEDGAILPRSASEMAITALHRAGAKQVDRLTAGIVEWELKFAGKKVLGDGKTTKIKTKNGEQEVSFRVIKPGDMLGSTHYVTGSISELNWNTFSGGAELSVMGIGAGGRAFMMTIAADLKLVDSRSTLVEDNVTFKKRVIGYETKAGVFKFFGTTLVDFNVGEKSQEPIQLALRSIVERSTYELLSRKVAADRKATCDVLLQNADDKVTTVETVPTEQITSEPVASMNGTGEGAVVIDPATIGTTETDTIATSGDSDAAKRDAWLATKTGVDENQ